MACIRNMPPINCDYEMEEGEIVDEVDDGLSDISSEEEFLLRQRLQVLENYNNVLERKAKRSFTGSGHGREDPLLQDLSEISATDLDERYPAVTPKTNLKSHSHNLKSHKQRRRKDFASEVVTKPKDIKKKTHRKKKPVKVVSESSEESDDEYRNKRRRLADAVVVPRTKTDKSSLQDRLQKMFGTITQLPVQSVNKDVKENETSIDIVDGTVPVAVNEPDTLEVPKQTIEQPFMEVLEETQKACECIELSTDDDIPIVISNVNTPESTELFTVSEKLKEEISKDQKSNSDDDLELLRQHALKTKSSKPKPDIPEIVVQPEKTVNSEDEDSDTAELRLICLKSALLKRAIERKQKQKLKKRLSLTTNFQDDFEMEQAKITDSANNTDIESVDMDMGSDNDDKVKDGLIENNSIEKQGSTKENESTSDKNENKLTFREDELEEDEDLLRAKLLTSLSKNLPNLVDPNILNDIEKENPLQPVKTTTTKAVVTQPENRIIINLGESDSEGEHEATKNLTKMHMKLSVQVEFQEKLDLFLKSTRMEVEKRELPDVVQEGAPPETEKPPQKFVAKAVKHLPKSEQIEYRNLVKRMAELEKVKRLRQTSIVAQNKAVQKDTLKPRNVSTDTTKLLAISNLEEKITLSRKRIAEESAKMLKLKEESKKLSQKYKIVATELRNISTAITLNKKEQRSVQISLTKIRADHQRLLSSSTFKHSKKNGYLQIKNATSNVKLQKENNPTKQEENTAPLINKVQKGEAMTKSIQPDVTNKQIVKVPDRNVEISNGKDNSVKEGDASLPVVEKGGGNPEDINEQKQKEIDDYKSPLQALVNATWESDPNAIVCPFEVGGNCKDPECKYFHLNVLTQ